MDEVLLKTYGHESLATADLELLIEHGIRARLGQESALGGIIGVPHTSRQVIVTREDLVRAQKMLGMSAHDAHDSKEET